MLHVAFVRSEHAHARINGIDTSAARNLPGVISVVTGEDIGDSVGSVPCAATDPAGFPGIQVPHHPVLAQGKVRFVGEPVVAIVATDRYIAQDGAELIEVDYEPLDAVSSGEQALDPGTIKLHDDFDNNQAFTWDLDSGDVAGALKSADHVIKQKFVHQRLAPNPMETRGVVAQYNVGDNQLTLWSSTQIPHILRTLIGLMLTIPENRVRVIAPEVGGGFGCKLNVYAEEALIGYLSRKLRRPVKWIESRRESMTHTIHGRDQIGDVEVGAMNDGTITSLKYTVIADVGAYFQLLTPAIPTLTGLMLCGCYKFKNVSMHLRAAFTNKMSTDAYRGAGRPEATYIIERIADMVAYELDMDPLEVRRKNFIEKDAFPYETGTAVTYDSGDYRLALDKALGHIDYEGLRKQQAELREQGRYVGIGFSTYVEICGMGPSTAMPAAGWESGTVRVEPTGMVTVLTGIKPNGQGQDTTFAQLIADGLGVDIDAVKIVHGDTDTVQYGTGTFGSRGTAVGGSAMVMAMEKIKNKVKKIAAHLLEAAPSDIELDDENRYVVKGQTDKGMTLMEVSLHAHRGVNLPPDTEPGLAENHFFEPTNFTYPFGTHIAIVEIDKETGDIDIQRYVAVDDCGKIINPMIVEGQVIGGIVQGLGQALYEEVIYDEAGQMLTGSFMDYALPKAHNFPRFELDNTVTPTPVNPMGVKGVGEAGTIGSTPAICNAVMDALKPFGVRHVDMPLRPEKLWRLMNS
jgi:carbon-monoxide dehydrogenase large subunit